MSTPTALTKIRNHPQFNELIRRRRTFVAWLTAATLLPYYAFLLVAGFMPDLLGTKVSDASVINVGWLVGLVLVVGSWLLTGWYIQRANGEFDELTAEILKGAK